VENFAQKLDSQESTVNQAQNQSAASFSKAATRLSASVKLPTGPEPTVHEGR
jgi:hypothetical protein